MNTLHALIKRVLKGERGVGMVMVVGFMGLAVPMLVAGLALSGTLSKDSQVKTKLAKDQYSSIGAREYIRYLSDDPDDWDDWLDDTGGEETITIDDDQIVISASDDGLADGGFLDFCIFGSSQVQVKENATINCSIGSNGNIDIKENATITGDIVAVGNVVVKENALVQGDVTAGGTVTVEDGAAVNGNIQQGASVDAIGGPTPQYAVTITITDENGQETVEYEYVEGGELPMTFDLTGGGDDVTVNAGETYNLLPGSYGDVEVKENATLNLSSGQYAFLQFQIKEWATINADVSGGPIVFDAVNDLEFKENITMDVFGGTAADIVVRVENQAQFKEHGDYLGTFFGFEASLAQMHVKEHATLTGALYGDQVEVKEHTEVHGMPAVDVYLSFFGS